MKTIWNLRTTAVAAVMALACLSVQARPHNPHRKPAATVVKKCGCKCRKHHRHHHKTKIIVVTRKCR